MNQPKLMTVVVLALTAFFATACVATRAAQAALEADLAALQTSVATLNDAEAAGAPQVELDALRAAVEANAAAVKLSGAAIPSAAKEDWAAFKDTTFMGLTQGGAQGGLLGLGLTALSWLARDRRKKLGGDPLQLAGVTTPPTNDGES